MAKKDALLKIDYRQNSGTTTIISSGGGSSVDTSLFLLRDGTQGMLANLDMGGFSVTNVNLLDGVDVGALSTAFTSHVSDVNAHHPAATAGTLISLSGQQVSLAAGAAYQFIGTGGDTIPEWRNVSELAGSGLTATNGVLAVGVSGLGLSVGADAVALASSSNPGAAASILASDASGYLRLLRLGLGMFPARPLDVAGDAGVSGQVVAGSGAFSGSVSITNGGDLTVGTVLQVSASGTRVGINRAADQEFDLDVAGAIRGQYLVGKHAIQLGRAVGVWHFDGSQPNNLDFTGSNASHMGVGGTESGGVIFRPGKFGKGVQMAGATTNFVTNPSFEVDTTGWSAVGSLSLSRVTSNAVYGSACANVSRSGTTDPYLLYSYNIGTALANRTFTVSYWWRGVESGQTQYSNAIVADGTYASAGTITASGASIPTTWTRVTKTVTFGAGVTSTTILLILRGGGVSQNVRYDAVQIEESAYATPYCDGSLGSGHSWSGTAHASTSSRSAARLYYSTPMAGNVGTIFAWIKTETPPTYRPSSIAYKTIAECNYASNGALLTLQYQSSSDAIVACYGLSASAFSLSSSWTPEGWMFVAVTWDGTTVTLYGGKPGTDGLATATQPQSAGRTFGSDSFDVGSWAGSSQFNGVIDEFVILDYAADAKLIRSIYESDAPVFVESSVFHWRAPSRVPIWVDEFGLWARGVSGNEILGLYGGDPRNPTGAVTKSWGGITMSENDIMIGRSAGGYIFWDDSAQVMTVRGAIVVQAGSSGIGTFTDAGALATQSSVTWSTQVTGTGKPADNATVGAAWGTNLTGRPTELTDGRITTAISSGGVIQSRVDPGVAWGANPGAGLSGLLLGSDYMGYWDGSTWRTYLDNSGRFYFRGSSGARLVWDGTRLFGGTSDTFNSSTAQWYVDSTDGKLVAGQGAVMLSSTGISVASSASTLIERNGYRLLSSDLSRVLGGIYGYMGSNTDRLEMNVYSTTGRHAGIQTVVDAPATQTADWILVVRNDSYTYGLTVSTQFGLSLTGNTYVEGRFDVNGVLGYDWALTPDSGWANYDTANYPAFGVRRFGDLVSIKGVITATVAKGAYAQLCQLAAEYRPARRRLFTCWSSAGITRVDVAADGRIYIEKAIPLNGTVSLEITYFTGG